MTEQKRTQDSALIEVKRSALDPAAGYTRKQPYIEVTYTCEICGKVNTRLQLAGRAPTVCKGEDGQKSKCEQEANRRRVAKHRQDKKSAQGG